MEAIPELSTLLKHSLNGATIKQCTTKNLVANGENYGSIMLAVDLVLKPSKKTEEKAEMHLVAKLCPSSEFIRQMFNTSVSFKKEVLMYETIVPTLQAFQLRRNPSCTPLNSFAKCYGSRFSLNPDLNKQKVVDENCCLVLENIKMLGFDIEDRMIGFNLDCAQFLVKDLAKLHAVPLAMKVLEPELFRKVIYDNICAPTYTRVSFPEDEAVKFINECIERAELLTKYQPHLPKIKKMMQNSSQNFYEVQSDMVEPYASLVHADYWTNNTMIKKNSHGKCIANCFVDFQMLIYGNPFGDLMFFLYSSVQIPVLKQHYVDLINLYFDTFIGVLVEMKVGAQSLKQFTKDLYLQEIDRCMRRMEMYHCLFMLTPIYAKKEKATELGDLDMASINDRSKMDSEKYYDRLEFVLDEFVKRGWLNL